MARTKKTETEGSPLTSKLTRRTSSPNGGIRNSKPPSLSPESERPLGPLSVVSSQRRDVIKVNTASATELKNACDDAVKRYLSRPELFNQIHLHTDVRLALGWLSVFVAFGTAFYGYKVDFEQSKPLVTIGLVVYIILTAVQSLYAYFIEGTIIFVGKRKTFSKRIIGERIQINSTTLPLSSPTLSTKPSPANAPSYQLAISYVRSTNGGKSLLAKGRTNASQSYSAFFDEKGTMNQVIFERWVGELVEQAMDGKSA